MQFKLAILTILAKRADGRATLDELRSEIGVLSGSPDQDLSSALKDIDIFQSGLITADGNRFRITQLGRAALAALNAEDTEAPPQMESVAAGIAVHPNPTAADPPPDVPEFLLHDRMVPSAGVLQPEISWRTTFSRLITVRFQKLRAAWRKHLEPNTANAEAGLKQPRHVSGAAIALLSLLAILICAGTLIALTQTRSLKVEATALQRELALLRERVARLEYERAAQALNRQKQSAEKSAAEQNRAARNGRTDQPALALTEEEIQMVREYIKPAPAASAPAPAINAGDTVSGATIPLPSQLMEKIPKLQGARFTTHNGAIIILKRDSRHADAVLPPR